MYPKNLDNMQVQMNTDPNFLVATIMTRMNGPFSDIAERLLLVRTALGGKDQSQKEYAETAGIPAKTYNNWETGNFRISLDGALKLREAYGVPLDFVYCGGMVDKLPEKVRNALRSRPRDNHSS